MLVNNVLCNNGRSKYFCFSAIQSHKLLEKELYRKHCWANKRIKHSSKKGVKTKKAIYFNIIHHIQMQEEICAWNRPLVLLPKLHFTLPKCTPYIFTALSVWSKLVVNMLSIFLGVEQVYWYSKYTLFSKYSFNYTEYTIAV